MVPRNRGEEGKAANEVRAKASYTDGGVYLL